MTSSRAVRVHKNNQVIANLPLRLEFGAIDSVLVTSGQNKPVHLAANYIGKNVDIFAISRIKNQNLRMTVQPMLKGHINKIGRASAWQHIFRMNSPELSDRH